MMPDRPRRQLTMQAVLAIFICLAVSTLAPASASEERAPTSIQADSILHRAVPQTGRPGGPAFTKVTPGRVFQFPQDHAPHPGFRIEWWYLTAILQDEHQRNWGLQWTLFRTALDHEARGRSWESPIIWMAHAALSAPVGLSGFDGHAFEQRFARAGINQAGVSSAEEIVAKGFEAWLDDWLLQGHQPGAMFPASLKLTIADKVLEFELRETGPLVLQGQNGFSLKSSDGLGSYYYSHPRLAITGRIVTEDTSITLDGLAWLDREWSSSFLANHQTGWDWFALHLEDGSKLMVYRLRDTRGADHLSGTLATSDGKTQHFENKAIRLTALETTTLDNGVVLPLRWRLELPEKQLAWTISTDNPEQFMATAVPYWEGLVKAESIAKGADGRGYMELTGYQKGD